MQSPTLSLVELEAFDPRARAGRIERRFCCPICGREKPMDSAHRCLCVNTETGLWNCKRCGTAGKLSEYIEHEDSRMSGKSARIERAKRAIEGSPVHKSEPNPESVAGYSRQVKKVASLAASPAEEYLLSRGISSKLAAASGCRYCPNWGKIGAAVVFPIRNENGRAIAAAGRAITGSGKQTFGPKSMGVFSTPGALDADVVGITEAPIDALTLALVGLPSVALCGTSGLPSWLITKLARPVKRAKSRTVYLAFDADEAGDAASAKIGEALMLVKTARLRPESAKDWNALLMDNGITSLLAIPEIARICAGSALDSFPGAKTPEIQNFKGKPGIPSSAVSRCSQCGAEVELVPYPDGNGWHWYECGNCGNTETVER